jgi:pyruvate kinase
MYIICSIGPRIDNYESIRELHKSGMNIARFNFSHIDYMKTENLINFIRNNMQELKVMQDLQGNKLRVGAAFGNEVAVEAGDRVVFCSEKMYQSLKASREYSLIIPVAIEGDFSSLHSAKTISMKDGTMRFKIVSKEVEKGNDGVIEAKVEIGGVIRAEKGINAPGMDRSKLGLTTKDKEDILWGLKNNVDIICLSYVSSEDNIIEMKKFIEANNIWGSRPKIWAKVESKEGYQNFQGIVDSCDGILFGRGDLYAEVDPVMIPYVQDKVMSIARKSGKDLVIATYVLSSMRSGILPLIPELNDIYNCIKKKVNGFMLATEVSVGKYPVHVVRTLKRMVDTYNKTADKE